MALAGIGVDILEIGRMERALSRHPSFARRVFTRQERDYCDSTARPAEHYAGRFVAREAVLKALGTGFAEGVGLKDVWVDRDESGQPRAVLEGRAAQIAAEKGVSEVALSLSFTREVAVANAVMVTDAVRPKTDKGDDKEQALNVSFKEARSILDELDLLQEGAVGQSELGDGKDDVARAAPAEQDDDAATDEAPQATQGKV